MHVVMSQDEGVSCITCGAYWRDEDEHTDRGLCSGRTDLTHGTADTSAHSLDGCDEYDEHGECIHLAAVAVECDCSTCRYA